MSKRNLPEPVHKLTIDWIDADRKAQFSHWLSVPGYRGADVLGVDSLRLASADASFRRYLRVDAQDGSRIIMDAPPDKEDCAAFAKVAHLMADAGLRAPQVLSWDPANGFMLLSDLGMQTMMQAIDRRDPRATHVLYLKAVDALIAWQRASRVGILPVYGQACWPTNWRCLNSGTWCTAHAVDGGVRRTPDDDSVFCRDHARQPGLAQRLCTPRLHAPQPDDGQCPQGAQTTGWACSTSRTLCTARSPMTLPV